MPILPPSTAGKKQWSLNIDPNFSTWPYVNTIFLDMVLKNFKVLINKRKKQLIIQQFVQYPKLSKTKVVSRSGRFFRSIKTRIINKSRLLFTLVTYYDPKYQSLQPIGDSPSITIYAKEKKFLAIPNTKNKLLFNPDGSYKYEGIPLRIDGEPNPEHPYSELIIRPRGKRDRTLNKQLRLTDEKGRIFYYLKRSVTIKTKRPISKVDKKLSEETQELLNQAFEEAFTKVFIKGKLK